MKLDPKDPFALHDRGVAYYQKHDIEHAIAYFEAVTKINPNFTVAARPRGEDARAQRGFDRGVPRRPDPVRGLGGNH